MCPKVSWDSFEVTAGVEERKVPDCNVMLTSRLDSGSGPRPALYLGGGGGGVHIVIVTNP